MRLSSLSLIALAALTACDRGRTPAPDPKSDPYAGLELLEPKGKPDFTLTDLDGKDFNFRRETDGYVTFLFFGYTHCPDVCPLIVSHIKTALALLGPKAKDVQVIAVSTDPRGDTHKTVAAFLKAHGMIGRMQYLIGTRAELGRAWKAWNIVAKPAKAGRDLVEHSALIYGIAADGKVTTLYAANFRPAQLVHDVPLLAAET